MRNYPVWMSVIIQKSTRLNRIVKNTLILTSTTIKVREMAANNGPPVMGKSKFIKKEEKAKGKWVAFNVITYQDPTGKERTWEGFERTTKVKGEADAVSMITVFRDPTKQCDCVILVRQFRPAIQAYTIEFPAGLIDAGETASVAAIREMQEETGYSVRVKHVSQPSALDAGVEDATMKYATCEVDMDAMKDQKDIKPVGGGCDEFTEVLIEPMNTLLQKLTDYSNNGEIVDSRVLIWALAKADTC